MAEEGVKGGVPVQLFARLVPSVEDEHVRDKVGVFASDRNVRIEDSNVSGPSWSFVYGEESTDRDIYERSLHPLVHRFIEGVNCTLLIGGVTKKTLEENGPFSLKTARNSGLVHDLCEGAMQAIRTRAWDRAGSNHTPTTLVFQFCELFEERLKDLLEFSDSSVCSVKWTEDGAVLDGAVRRPVGSPEEMKATITDALERRDAKAADRDIRMERRHLVLLLEFSHKAKEGEKSVQSKCLVVQLAPLNTLSRDKAEVRVRDGVNTHKSLFHVEQVLKENANTAKFGLPYYSRTQLTQLLEESLSGNCASMFLLLIPSSGSRSALEKCWQFSVLLGKSETFPVVNENLLCALLKKYRLKIAQLQESSAVPSEKSSSLETQLFKIHELEGKLVKFNLEKMKIMEEKDKVVEALKKLHEKYNELVEAKTALSSKLLASEEEKLKLSKAFVDLKIQNASLLQDVDSEKFDVMNRLLATENDLVEVRGQLHEKEEKLAKLEQELKQSQVDYHDLSVEFVAVKTNFINLTKDLDEERGKTEELGIEILNLSNAKRMLQMENDSLRSGKELTEKEKHELVAQAEHRDAIRRNYEKEIHDLREEKERIRNEQAERIVELEKKVMMADQSTMEWKEKMLAMDREKLSEFIEKGKEKDDEIRLLVVQKDKLLKEKNTEQREHRKTKRILEDYEQSQEQMGQKMDTIVADNEELVTKFVELEKQYSKQTEEFAAQLTSLPNESSEILTHMFEQFTDEHVNMSKAREERMSEELKKHVEEISDLSAKNENLADACRKMRFLVEDYSAECGDMLSIPTEQEIMDLAVVSSTEKACQEQLTEAKERMISLESELSEAQRKEIEIAKKHESDIFQLRNEILQLKGSSARGKKRSRSPSGISDDELAQLRAEVSRIPILERDLKRAEDRVRRGGGGDSEELESLRRENKDLKEEMDRVQVDGTSNDSRRVKLVRDLAFKKQQELERQIIEWKNRALVAEDQLAVITSEMNKRSRKRRVDEQ